MGQYPVTDFSFSPTGSSGTYCTVKVRNRVKLFLITDMGLTDSTGYNYKEDLTTNFTSGNGFQNTTGKYIVILSSPMNGFSSYFISDLTNTVNIEEQLQTQFGINLAFPAGGTTISGTGTATFQNWTFFKPMLLPNLSFFGARPTLGSAPGFRYVICDSLSLALAQLR